MWVIESTPVKPIPSPGHRNKTKQEHFHAKSAEHRAKFSTCDPKWKVGHIFINVSVKNLRKCYCDVVGDGNSTLDASC